MRACGDYFVHVDERQFDVASPPNPLPHRGGGTSNLYLLHS